MYAPPEQVAAVIDLLDMPALVIDQAVLACLFIAARRQGPHLVASFQLPHLRQCLNALGRDNAQVCAPIH